jgi:hypothetical protein
VDLIRWEDRLHQHEYYQRAVRGAARCYLALHRNRADITARPAAVDTGIPFYTPFSGRRLACELLNS